MERQCLTKRFLVGQHPNMSGGGVQKRSPIVTKKVYARTLFVFAGASRVTTVGQKLCTPHHPLFVLLGVLTFVRSCLARRRLFVMRFQSGVLWKTSRTTGLCASMLGFGIKTKHRAFRRLQKAACFASVTPKCAISATSGRA